MKLKIAITIILIPILYSTNAFSQDGCDTLNAEYKFFGILLKAGLTTEDKVQFCKGIKALTEKVSKLEVELEDKGVKKGSVAYFNGSCPENGWREFVAARGRYVVAANSVDSIRETVGIKLEDGEDRAAGSHTHDYIDKNSSGNGNPMGGGNGGIGRPNTPRVTDPNDSKDGTNAPYILLRACEKT